MGHATTSYPIRQLFCSVYVGKGLEAQASLLQLMMCLCAFGRHSC